MVMEGSLSGEMPHTPDLIKPRTARLEVAAEACGTWPFPQGHKCSFLISRGEGGTGARFLLTRCWFSSIFQVTVFSLLAMMNSRILK